MKTFKSLVALAVLASLTFNAFTANATQVASETITGIYLGTDSSVQLRVAVIGAQPAKQIAVLSHTYPQFDAQTGDVINAGSETIEVPAQGPGARTYVANSTLFHGPCFVFVATNLHSTTPPVVQLLYLR